MELSRHVSLRNPPAGSGGVEGVEGGLKLPQTQLTIVLSGVASGTRSARTPAHRGGILLSHADPVTIARHGYPKGIASSRRGFCVLDRTPGDTKGLSRPRGRKDRSLGHLPEEPSSSVMPLLLKSVGLRGETIRQTKTASVKRTWEASGQKRRPSGEVWVSSPLGRVYLGRTGIPTLADHLQQTQGKNG